MGEALTNLGRYRDVPLEKIEQDLSLVWIAEKGLETLIQNAPDIGAHILASEVRTDWDDYGDIISKLGKYGILLRIFPNRFKVWQDFEISLSMNIIVSMSQRFMVI
jgi:uncharacterized protein YutE (UPF0331/DUF86 family)